MTIAIPENSNTPPPYIDRPPTRHEYYYFEDGNLIFQAGTVLFKLWKGPLVRHSTYFAERCSQLSTNDLKVLEGSDDTNPIFLHSVEGKDMERLLWIIYPRTIGKYEAQTVEDWTAILNLACKWSFNDIKDMAIKELGSMELDPSQCIGLQQKYGIEAQWAYNSYVTLCARNEPLTLTEGELLGLEATIKIFCVREKLERWGRKKLEDVQKNVCEVFQLDPAKMNTKK